MAKVIIYYTDSGKSYEIREDRAGLGIYLKVKGFRDYEKALKYAEKESLERHLELVDTTKPKEQLEVLPDHSTSTNSEEKLLKAIFGDSYRGEDEGG